MGENEVTPTESISACISSHPIPVIIIVDVCRSTIRFLWGFFFCFVFWGVFSDTQKFFDCFIFFKIFLYLPFLLLLFFVLLHIIVNKYFIILNILFLKIDT